MKESDWQTLLDQDWTDTTLRLQYSDWLEENGNTASADFQRWLVQNRKHPNRTCVDWEWWLERVPGVSGHAPHRELPAALFCHLGSQRPYHTYSGRAAAENALAAAWHRAKVAGWQP
jgi:uncharacterized protein (TIGR02996 family)